ncbi:MAG: flagellar filament capping protein FliD [Helicobacteraceae bacterium]|nr:flagellar filament capping protein FliD [Helicobacteraceae bacterium]
MAGNISSLGIGSGVLTADVIDQLRAADESAIIKPIDRNIELNTKKQEAFSLLSSLMTTFKSSTSALSDDTIFDNKEVNVSGDAEVSVLPGVNIDSFSLETVSLATKDVTKFGSFADRDKTSVALGTGTLTINDIEIEYNSSMKLEDLAQAITDAGGDSFSASILQTGENAFDLIVSSKETGAANALTITDTSALLKPELLEPADPITNPSGFEKVQTASDAEFKYDGIKITRPSNTISDLIVGVDITLKKEGDISNVNVNLKKDTIVDEVQMFVDGYNELLSKLNDLSLADVETGEEGIFSNESFIKSISREMSSMLSSMTVGGKSLTGLGHETTNVAGDPVTHYVFDLSRDGRLSFNSSNLESMLDDDPESLRGFFSGTTDADGVHTPGLFDMMDEKLLGYTGSGKMFSNFETSLETAAKNLSQSRIDSIKSLDMRYATMSSRFAAYDSMISQINAQFASLQMMINDQSK